PARHAEAPLQPDGGEHGPRLEPHPRLALRRHRPAHAGGPGFRRARRRGRLPGSRARAGRPVRRLRLRTTTQEARDVMAIEVLGTDHLDLTVYDLERSTTFYDAALAELGFRRIPDKNELIWANAHPAVGI